VNRNEQRLDLAGKVALVTGSTRGLGYEIARSLGSAGAAVALNYSTDTSRGNNAFQQYLSTGATGALFQADVTKASQVKVMIANVVATLGSIDILVINATPSQPQRSLEDYEWSDVQSMGDAFIKSPFLLAKAVVPHMKSQRFGRIIQIGSEVLDEGTPNFSAYVAAKGGQHALTRSLSKELAKHNITVNTVSPGWIPVERHASVPQVDKEAYFKTIPMGRWGTPADVASAVIFFASAHASFVTGANLHVNGGRTVQ